VKKRVLLVATSLVLDLSCRRTLTVGIGFGLANVLDRCKPLRRTTSNQELESPAGQRLAMKNF